MKKKLIAIISLVMSVIFILPVGSYATETKKVELVQPGEAELSSAGKLTTNLVEKYSYLSDSSTIQTTIWMEDIDMSVCEEEALKAVEMSKDEWDEYLNGTPDNEVIKKYISVKRQAAANLYTKYNQQLSKKFLNDSEIVYTSMYAPVIMADLTYSRALEVSKNKTVCSIDFYQNSFESDSIMSTPESNNTSAVASTMRMYANDTTRVTNVHNSASYGYTGDGVVIGVLEKSLPEMSEFTQYDIRHVNSVYDYNYVHHANMTLDFLTSVAPDAIYYFGIPTGTKNDFEIVERFLYFNAQIINLSYPFGGDDVNQYGNTAKWLDHLAYFHDVHVVMATGNEIGNVQSGAMAYNIITVGNIDDKGTPLNYSDDVLGEETGYISAGANNGGKPDICAPGTNLNTRFTEGSDDSSWSAAQVTGIVALMCEQRPALLTKQDVVKAILVSSVNFSAGAFEPDEANYAMYGAGTVDAIGACWVNAMANYVQSSLASPTGTGVNTHYFTVGASDTRIRVAMAFIVKSNPSSGGHNTGVATTTGVGDLNIRIYDPNNNVVDYSMSYYNNVEICDFVPTVTGTYRIEVFGINQYDARTYYAVAWR